MADGSKFIGIRKKAEIDPTRHIRDIRSWGEKFAASAKSEETALFCALLGTATAIMLPEFSDLLAIPLVPYSYYIYKKLNYYQLPLRVPQVANVIDAKNLAPGTNLPRKGNGIFYVGFDRNTGEPIFLSNSDLRQHQFTMGTTGSGKSEFLISKVTNALNWGSGFIYVDGKADTGLYAKVYSLARRYGRDDDILVCNFMTGNRDTLSAEGNSNTLNPFVTGSSSSLTELITSLMSETSGGDGSMWKQRAQYLIAGLMSYLCFKRDRGELLLDVATVREHLPLNQFLCLTLQAEKDQIDHKIRDQLWAYLESIPEFSKDEVLKHPYVPGQAPKVSPEVHKQHGFLHMQFAKLLGSLADAYGYIFRSQLADIDMYDVVINRRILLILLPPLEKSPDEIANLGKVIVATLKGMMAATLGSEIEGDVLEIIENRPTNAETPFQVTFDEFGIYAEKGMPVMAAQARGLGFSLDFSTQDMNSVLARLDKEAYAIVANTNTFFALKVSDPKETLELVVKMGGEAYVARATHVNFDSDGLGTGGYRDNLQAQVEKKERIEFDDLKSQTEGQAHVMFGTNVIRATLFFANPPQCRYIRFNRFIGIEPTLLLDTGPDIDAMKDVAKFIISEKFDDVRAKFSRGGPDAVTLDKVSWLLSETGVTMPVEIGVIGLMTLSSPEWDTAEQEMNSMPLGGAGQGGGGSDDGFVADFDSAVFDPVPANPGYVPDDRDDRPQAQAPADRKKAISQNDFAKILDQQIVDTRLPETDGISDADLEKLAAPVDDAIHRALLEDIPKTTIQSILGDAGGSDQDMLELDLGILDLTHALSEKGETGALLDELTEKTKGYNAGPEISTAETYKAMSSRPANVQEAVASVKKVSSEEAVNAVNFALRKALENYSGDED